MLRWERPVLTQCTAGLRRAIAYALASLDLDSLTPHDLLRLWRQHWPIENHVHSVRDLTLGVDAGRVRTANAPRALAAIRNTILSTLRLRRVPTIAEALRTFAQFPYRALAHFILV